MKRLTLLCLFLFAGVLGSHAQTATLTIELPGNKELLTVVIELYSNDAPQTVANFTELARRKFYRKQTFHRALPGKLVQTGDPGSKKKKPKTALGTGGPGYTIPAEIKRKVERGSVATGRLGNTINPNKASNGSQFFIALDSLPTLSGEYTVFGKVVSGLEVLETISKTETDSNGAPISRITIRSLTVE